jgi:exonuclease SbcC
MFTFRSSKPQWESRDAAERARGVATADLSVLGARLAEFARGDESAEVRAAAIKRLDDLPLLGDRARLDGDAAVRSLAMARYRALLAGAESLPLDARERVLRVEDDPEVLAHVAAQAPEATLRRLAIDRSSRPGLVAERCQRDPDPELRLELLSRIDQVATLERIAEAVRKSDKRLSHAARERAFALRLAAGEPEARRTRALQIADALDQLRRERPDDLVSRYAALLGEWQALAPWLGEDLVRRVQGFVSALDAALAPRRAAEPIEADPVAAVPRAQPADPAPIAVDPDPELLALADEAEGHAGYLDDAGVADLRRRHALAWDRAREHLAAEVDARQRFDAALAGVRERLAREAAARAAESAVQRAEREAQEAAARERLGALEAALDAERAQDARDAHAALVALREARALPAALNRRFGTVQERYERLVRWQQWSNNKVRSRLCEEIEALASAAAHPDAVATRVREAQAEWQRLDASERVDASAAGKSGLARRFRGICHRAMAPTREYFEKRGELRQRQREGVDALLARAEGDLPTDLRETTALRRELAEALRGLDGIDPRTRAGLGKRLRAGLQRIDDLRDARNANAEADKRKVIAQLRRQLAQSSGAEALALVRDAQGKLAVMTRAGREAEESLRAELAALVDPLFESERAAREGELTAAREREAAVAAVVAELESLARAGEDELRHADAKLTAIGQRWRELAPPAPPREAAGRDRDAPRGGARPGPRGDDRRGGRDDRPRPPRDDLRRDEEKRFDAAVERVRAAQRQAQARARAAESTNLLLLAQACADLEAALLDGEGPAVDAAGAALREASGAVANPPAPLRARIARALGWLETRPDPAQLAAMVDSAQATAHELALRAEAARGADSPAAFKDQRRAWQLRRLAERMSGGAAPDPVREKRELLDAWLGCGPLPAAMRTGIAARIEPTLGVESARRED